jgi:NifU-like protein involved in Fe-S cluster formation
MNYPAIVLEHFYAPRGQRCNSALDDEYCLFESGRAGSLDSFRLTLTLEGAKITGACFKALGCPYLIALLSYLCERLIGEELAYLKALSFTELVAQFEIPRTKWYLVTKVLDCLREGNNDHEK